MEQHLKSGKKKKKDMKICFASLLTGNSFVYMCYKSLSPPTAWYGKKKMTLVMYDPESRGIVAIYISCQQPAACLWCCCMDIDNLSETLAETKQVILCWHIVSF